MSLIFKNAVYVCTILHKILLKNFKIQIFIIFLLIYLKYSNCILISHKEGFKNHYKNLDVGSFDRLCKSKHFFKEIKNLKKTNLINVKLNIKNKNRKKTKLKSLIFSKFCYILNIYNSRLHIPKKISKYFYFGLKYNFFLDYVSYESDISQIFSSKIPIYDSDVGLGSVDSSHKVKLDTELIRHGRSADTCSQGSVSPKVYKLSDIDVCS